jgi:ankyrin repeat protein
MSGDLITCLAAFACIAVLTVPLVDGFCMRRGSGGPFLPLRWMPRCDCKVGNRNRGAVAEAMRLRGGSWEFRAIIPMRNRGHGHDREPRSLQPPPRSEAEPRPRTNLYPSYNNNAEATRLQASWNLLTSCSRADLGAVKSLVTAGAIDFDVRDSLGRTPLHIAACLDRGGEDIAMAILDCAEGRLLLHAYDNRGMCPIHVAASSGNAGVLEILLGDMNQGVLTGQRRNREIKDAIAIRDKHGRTAMHHAAAQVPRNFPPLAVSRATKLNHVCSAQVGAECVRMLLSCKEGESLVNETDTLGLSALHYAASSMVSERISEMLIDAGASLDARDVEGKTSLMMACGDVPPAPTERIHRTVLLLAACGGRDLTMAVDRFGANCMLHAAAENKSDIVRLLLRLPEGAELARTADYVGQTPLLKACKYGHAEVVKVLLEEVAGGLELVEAWDNQVNRFFFGGFIHPP